MADAAGPQRRKRAIELLEASMAPPAAGTPSSGGGAMARARPRPGDASEGPAGPAAQAHVHADARPARPQLQPTHERVRVRSERPGSAGASSAPRGPRQGAEDGGTPAGVPARQRAAEGGSSASTSAGGRSVYLPIGGAPGTEAGGESRQKWWEFDLEAYLERRGLVSQSRGAGAARHVYQSKVADKVLVLETSATSMQR